MDDSITIKGVWREFNTACSTPPHLLTPCVTLEVEGQTYTVRAVQGKLGWLFTITDSEGAVIADSQADELGQEHSWESAIFDAGVWLLERASKRSEPALSH